MPIDAPTLILVATCMTLLLCSPLMDQGAMMSGITGGAAYLIGAPGVADLRMG